VCDGTLGVLFLKHINMNYQNYLDYKVYENGKVVNLKGITLKPQIKGSYSYYEIQGKKFSATQIVLLAFKIYPKFINQRVKRLDNNILNNSLNNLVWK